MKPVTRRFALAAVGAGGIGLVLPRSSFARRHPEDELALHELEILTEMRQTTYRGIWNNLRCLNEGELAWRPHPEANSLHWVVGHLNWFEEWVSDAIEDTGMYRDERGGPTSVQEATILDQKARFDAAHDRLDRLVASLGADDLSRSIRYIYNEERDGRSEISLQELLRTHVRHQAGHRYQIRYIRGTYSRAHETDKACFDPW